MTTAIFDIALKLRARTLVRDEVAAHKVHLIQTVQRIYDMAAMICIRVCII